MDISEIISKVRAQGDVADCYTGKYQDPEPLDPAALAQLRLPSGDPIPDDLAIWLAYDASWLGLLSDGQLKGQPLRGWLIELMGQLGESYEDEDEELREWVADDTGEESVSDEQLLAWWIEQLPSPELADVPMVRLPSGDQDSLLMLEPGRKSLRILGFHKFIELWWKYETFADYLAHWLGFEER